NRLEHFTHNVLVLKQTLAADRKISLQRYSKGGACKMDSTLTLYHGSQFIIEQPVFGKGVSAGAIL
ncbi:hypothetical protein, partial [uncultured Phocaeicola sp.]|uniref:hypothetical protein n=1 Tax=uncultured Phocaeicola sp. TaxID=990718 RepID=UPI0032208254